MEHDHSQHSLPRSPQVVNWIIWCFVAIAGFFLITEHWAHLFGILPFLLLLACPLMHLFMHHGHGGHGGHSNDSTDRGGAPRPEDPNRFQNPR